ncbi:hypothetical protein M8J77_014717 [Diaphorina citri]|nr:hypothetical protein M8J77_014717 [Diaphorina citri]
MTSPNDDGEENVRFLIMKEESDTRQEFKYKSKYADKIRRDYQVVKQGHQTMGYAQVPLNPPSQYLKKHTRPMLKAQVDHHCLGRHSPRRTFPGAMDEDLRDKENQTFLKSGTNFVRANVERVGKMLPRQRERRVVDQPGGHTELDMTPVYVFRKNFGKTPEYIIRRKHQYERHLREQHTADTEDISLPFYQISEQERLDILQGLKNYWSELQREFQLLPLKIDTEPLKKRKSTLENKLKSLEKDIDLMERHEYIYVMQDRDN